MMQCILWTKSCHLTYNKHPRIRPDFSSKNRFGMQGLRGTLSPAGLGNRMQIEYPHPTTGLRVGYSLFISALRLQICVDSLTPAPAKWFWICGHCSDWEVRNKGLLCASLHVMGTNTEWASQWVAAAICPQGNIHWGFLWWGYHQILKPCGTRLSNPHVPFAW